MHSLPSNLNQAVEVPGWQQSLATMQRLRLQIQPRQGQGMHSMRIAMCPHVRCRRRRVHASCIHWLAPAFHDSFVCDTSNWRRSRPRMHAESVHGWRARRKRLPSVSRWPRGQGEPQLQGHAQHPPLLQVQAPRSWRRTQTQCVPGWKHWSPAVG